ncbi:MAG: GNAT family N-acetyltransferase [Bacteroidia bacterium]
MENLTTERLILIPVNQEIMDHVFANLSAVEQMNFLGCKSSHQLEEQQRRHRQGLSTFNKKFHYFFIREKTTNKHMGWCGFHTWHIDHQRAEIGYGIDEEFRQRGFMKEALKPIIQFGFSVMNLHRIEAFAAEYNTASVRLLEIFGFNKEGVLKEHYKVNGKNEDSTAFALLKKDYLLV